MQTTQHRRSRNGSSSSPRHNRNGSSSSKRRPFSSSGSRRRNNNISNQGPRRGGGSFRGGRHHGKGRRTGRGGRVQPTFDPSQFINKNPVEQKEEIYTPKHTFKDFGLVYRLVKTVHNLGITTPSPIQDQAIPEILKGRDVIGLAETGTGKTAAFLLPLIHKTDKEYNRQTIILTPTRELALQIEAEFRKLSKSFKQYATTCVGGTNIRPQINALRRKNHFIIGTPGRILDLIDRGNLKMDRISTVVLDEADRMLDMGFIHDMRKIMDAVPHAHETLFFSATMSKDIEALVHDFLTDPVTISVKKKDVTNSIEQDVVPFAHSDKFHTLTELLEDPAFKRVIIFGAMKHSVEKLSKALVAHGIASESIHGNKSHGQRQHSLRKFKSGNARVLVATDVAARGIHVDNVSHVINYDLPSTFEDYVHRIGRTGRGTQRGKALTFIAE